ncbi:carbohydrate ABC transporter permease [Glycomyces algeriensis]|uniref:ABC transporter permease n=1 Tax=Glycomyces algeriensis TaxID=256037 RepID=A0A9W6GAD3_9ACTN|nr:carbohydrate ABC transporter permease [Glycomyces algeriensis]MDA1364542.1 carbohydrate ABC transporter permease [Glycomyces algeriensis]MDR7350578.1 putative aldouronate transport system permease protein [Glycomyces algeriensis]GLI43286.1 ABC transporter permease [Glycomyces algeriensis]
MSSRNRPAWEEKPSAAGLAAKGASIVVIALLILFPLYTIALTSLSSGDTVNRVGGLVIWPGDGVTFEAYEQMFRNPVVLRSLVVSLGITAVGTFISVVVSILGAYSLSRPGSFGHKTILFSVLLMFVIFPGLIPVYLWVSAIGLRDNYLAIILPMAVSAFNVVVLRAFFMSIPQELFDSARIDGAGEFRVLWQIVAPLSKAVIAVVTLFYAVAYWNNWFNAFLYLDDTGKWPLALVLRTYVVESAPLPQASGLQDAPPTLAVKMAIVMIAIIPALIIYPFVQKHFKKGVIIGAVKG